MCGRLVQTARALKALWRWREELTGVPPGFNPHYNIAPTSEILTVHTMTYGWLAGIMRWCLIPSWRKDGNSTTHTDIQRAG